MAQKTFRVFGGNLLTETNSFSAIPTTMESFRAMFFADGKTPLDNDNVYERPLVRAKTFFEARGGTFTTTLRTFSQPSAPVERKTWEILRDTILADLAAAMPVDIVVLGLHGAMMAEGEDDCEGALLEKVRAVVGPRAVIGSWLDPHAHLTTKMVDTADILCFYKEYPHTDIDSTAAHVVDLCWETWEGKIDPVMAVADPHLIKSWPTYREPTKSFVGEMRAIEQRGEALAVSLVHGFPWGDSPDLGTKVLVIADGDRGAAQAIADALAATVSTMRNEDDYALMSVDAAIDAAIAETQGPVVLADLADNPGGGAAQDSTFILERLIARNVADTAVAAIHDPLSVADCLAAGEGATLELSIGGRHGKQSGLPVQTRAVVMAVRRPLMQSALGGEAQTSAGDAVWVRVGKVDIILCSRREQVFSTDIFTNIGIDPLARHILVVKSSNHFQASFSKVATRIIYVGTPGTLNTDLRTVPYAKAPRSLWPLCETR